MSQVKRYTLTVTIDEPPDLDGLFADYKPNELERRVIRALNDLDGYVDAEVMTVELVEVV